MDGKFAPLISGAVDLMLTFVTHEVDNPGLYSEILCQPNTCALMRAGHPALNKADPKIALKHLAKYPHIFIQDGPAFPLFYNMYRDRNLEPEIHMVSNISPGAQSFVSTSDAISLRIVRPSSKYSPLESERKIGFTCRNRLFREPERSVHAVHEYRKRRKRRLQAVKIDFSFRLLGDELAFVELKIVFNVQMLLLKLT